MFQQVADPKVVWYICLAIPMDATSIHWRFTYVLWQSMFSPQCNHHNPIYQRESLLFSSRTTGRVCQSGGAVYLVKEEEEQQERLLGKSTEKAKHWLFVLQLSWSEPLVTNLMQNKPNWWQFSADHLPFLDLSSDWLHFLSPGKKQMLLVDSFETERLRLRRLRRLTGVWRAPPPWDEKQPWEEGGRLGRH